jgi:hypothetical protein
MGLLTGVISSQAVKQSNINDPLDHFIGGDEAADATGTLTSWREILFSLAKTPRSQRNISGDRGRQGLKPLIPAVIVGL